MSSRMTNPTPRPVTSLDVTRVTITSGLLGASCSQEEFDICGTKLLEARRLLMIEERILAIESELGFLNPGGQYGGNAHE